MRTDHSMKQPNRMSESDKEFCISCQHPVTFDGFNYKHNYAIESYCCTATKKFVVTNPVTKREETVEVGCICINAKGNKHRFDDLAGNEMRDNQY